MNIAVSQNASTDKNRSTTARKAILICFSKQQEPIDYEQIMSFLTDNLVLVNKTTVYRQLDSLQKNGIIQEIDLGEGKKRYEITSRHHHHLLCSRCKKIECIEFHENLDPQLSEISKSTKFKVTGHILEFLGICEQCQQKIGGINHA